MQDNTLIILGICGVALVFMAIGAFLFFWITRSLNRFFIVGLVRRLIGGVDDITDDDESGAAYVAQRQRRDLRAQAQSLDFDSAVARHRGEPVPPTQPVDASAQSTPSQNTTPTPDANTPSLRSQRRRRRNANDESLDEVFGGMLDTDGDGDVDF
jgi:hypothetical protein